jgi:hypothetical protein
MLSLHCLLAAAACQPLPPEPVEPARPARAKDLQEAVTIIEAELAINPLHTAGEVRAYVHQRARELLGRPIDVTYQPPAAPAIPATPHEVLPEKTRRRRERRLAQHLAKTVF